MQNADDTQLFFSFHPLNFDSSISQRQNALQQISSWMTDNLLILNSFKTEFLLTGLKNQLAKIHNSSFDTSYSARNLGFVFDKHLTFSGQITSLSNVYSLASLYLALPRFVNCLSTIATSTFTQNLLTVILSTIKFISLNYPVSSRSRTLLLVLSLKLLISPVISLSSYALASGSESLSASNTSFSLLPTKFSQSPKLLTFINSSLFNVLAVLALHPSLVLLGHPHHRSILSNK